MNYRVQQLSSDGDYITSIGSYGSDAGPFRCASWAFSGVPGWVGVGKDGSQVGGLHAMGWLLVARGGRLSQSDPTLPGQARSMARHRNDSLHPLLPNCRYPYGIAVLAPPNGQRTVYVGDGNRNDVQVFDEVM